MTISNDHEEDLYRFIWKIVIDKNCKLIRIGGIQNHIHLLINLNPAVALASLMREVKANSSSWMKGEGMFPEFEGWAKEYYACTLSPQQQDNVIEYIKGQKAHHLGRDFEDEIKGMCKYADMDYYDDDFR